MLPRVRSVSRNRQTAVLVCVFVACVLLMFAVRSTVCDFGVEKTVSVFWRAVLARNLEAAGARLSPAADIDLNSLVSKYGGYIYRGVPKTAIKVEKDIAVVPIELTAPSGNDVSVLTIVQKEGRVWRIRSTSTSR